MLCRFQNNPPCVNRRPQLNPFPPYLCSILILLLWSLSPSRAAASADEVSSPTDDPIASPIVESRLDAPPLPSRRKLALGFTLDLLPVAMSAASGHFGMSGQTWVGIDSIKIRLVGARMNMPDFLVGNDAFGDQQTTVGALIVDYVFGEAFDGWWVGTGFELWENRIVHKSSAATQRWLNLVYTLGGGYIWKFYDNLYLNPWVGLHVPINNPRIHAGSDSFKPLPVSGEVSLKIGYYFDL